MSKGKKQVKITQNEERELKCNLTPEEHKEKAMLLAEAYQESVKMGGEKKAVMAEFTAKIAKKEEEIAALAKLVNDGFEYRKVKCELHFHTPSHGMKTVIRTDTKETVGEERMLQREHNLFTQDPGQDLSDFHIGE